MMQIRKGRRAFAVAVGVATLAMLASGCAGSDTQTEEPVDAGDPFADMAPIALTFNNIQPPGGIFEDSTNEFIDYIEKATDGKVTFETFYSGSLLTDADSLTGVGDGIADISVVAPLAWAEQLPVNTWLHPAMSQDRAEFPVGDLANLVAVWDLAQTDETILAEYEASNVHALRLTGGAAGEMLCVDPVDDLGDLKGRTVRANSQAATEEVQALGMVPTSIAFAEMYEGLQRGVIDCIYGNGGNQFFKDFGFTEVAKNYLAVNGWLPAGGQAWVINLDTWNSFPDELKRVFSEAAAGAAIVELQGMYQSIATFGETAKADGVDFVDTAEAREVLKKVQDKAYDSMLASAPSNVSDPDKLIGELQDAREKWQALLVDGGVVAAPAGEVTGGEELQEAYAGVYDSIDWDAFRALLQEQILEE